MLKPTFCLKKREKSTRLSYNLINLYEQVVLQITRYFLITLFPTNEIVCFFRCYQQYRINFHLSIFLNKKLFNNFD
ncbi:hypothetical protein T458_10160 [Brevibacillus panacihumi W25]|uniref:Uncharacterized protein n=1 Tax=Brevibacillus panacihumi W25 TaxID=1408254 RepID=V6MA13_9BACL|nr:hypothetical protein T458_10160 [Brevibacillus panacihumi W25]